ncbi:MAG: hypothetical protein DWI21_01955 [Planctomycetota bacterium]|nr:MAG: hypothetical protein DWI21_01955 [Planctomycetota bacterium]
MIEQLTAQQRKLAYLIGMVVLMLPIIVLGMPATDEEGSGGKLARLRQEHDLGESTLGKVDPTSATMNLVLLGMRGVAVNLLRMQLDTQRDQKQWAQMRATTESVILLQPHYIQVWRYLGWNLAYNVSAEWDAVEDRYFWVKEGAKFFMQGAERNRLDPEVYWDTGNTLGKKIGRSDEWKQFRRFFKEDPDKDRYDGGPDSEINPDRKDNYLAAKDWFKKANDAEEKHEQHIMMDALFRSYPARSQLDYADALQREGQFDETTRKAWEDAYRDWVEDFGYMRFKTTDYPIFMEAPASESAMEQIIAASGKDRASIEREIDFYQNVCNYRFWRTKAHAEKQLNTTRMHSDLFEGEDLFKKGDIDAAQEVLETGLQRFKTMLETYVELGSDDITLEEGLWGIMLWQKIYQLKNQVQPEEFPLKGLWEKELNRVPNLQHDFNRKYGSS